MSFGGLVVSLLGGLLIGLTFFLSTIYSADTSILLSSPPQWPIIVIGGIAGLFGSLIDSLLGATLQYSGIDEKGRIVERSGEGVRYITGRRILDNHSVNLVSSIITALVMPGVAIKFWHFFL